jgi:hypothetical protein
MRGQGSKSYVRVGEVSVLVKLDSYGVHEYWSETLAASRNSQVARGWPRIGRFPCCCGQNRMDAHSLKWKKLPSTCGLVTKFSFVSSKEMQEAWNQLQKKRLSCGGGVPNSTPHSQIKCAPSNCNLTRALFFSCSNQI